jgi:hypothetical protein
MKRLVFTIIVTVLTVVSWSLPIQLASAIPTHRTIGTALTAQERSVANACAHSTKGMLEAVSATSTRNVWVVGEGFNYDKVVIEHWDGTCWQVMPTAALAGNLASVVAISPRDVWAVGATAAQDAGSLIMHAPVTSPAPQCPRGCHDIAMSGNRAQCHDRRPLARSGLTPVPLAAACPQPLSCI